MQGDLPLTKASSTPGEKLFRANLRYFDRHLPAVAAYIRTVTRPISKIVWEDGKAVDVDLGKGRLYKKPAQEFVREQIDRYFVSPERVILNQPEGVHMKSSYAIDMLRYISEEVHVKRKVMLIPQPKDSIGFLLIIGVGLGLHIEELINRTKAKTVIIVEPIAELLYHSLHVVDWAALCRRCKKEKIKLVFTNTSSANAVSGQVNNVIFLGGSFRLDGSYIYTHYTTHVTSDVRNKVKEMAPYMMVVKGWFEDEVDKIGRAHV